MALTVPEVKVIGLIIMFVGNVVLGLIPLKLVGWLQNAETNHPRFHNTLGIINCFTGGVFFGTFLIHLLPDVNSSFQDLLYRWDIDPGGFPAAEFTISLGFFLVLIIESIVSMCHARHRHERRITVHTRTSNDYGTFGDETTSYEQSYEERTFNSNTPDIQYSTDLQSSVETIDVLRETSMIRAFIFLISLSLHSLFAGLAIGLVQKIDSAVMLLIAVNAHKWIIAFALGVELVQASLTKFKCVIYMVFFAAMSPIGVVIGIFIDADSSDLLGTLTASCFLQAMAAGTFLYVTFFEVLGKEFNERNDLIRILSVIIGFAAMTGLKFLETPGNGG